ASTAGILNLKILTVTKRQRGDEFGLNLHRRKMSGVEGEINLNVLGFIKSTVNGYGTGRLTIKRNEQLRSRDRFESRLSAPKLCLGHDAVVIAVQVDESCRIIDREDQCRLQPS